MDKNVFPLIIVVFVFGMSCGIALCAKYFEVGLFAKEEPAAYGTAPYSKERP